MSQAARFAVFSLLLLASGRIAFSFPNGAPSSACTTLTQSHFGSSVTDCGADCPFSVSLTEIDGTAVAAGTQTYKCGSLHTLRIQSSDSTTFRGFAIQARQSTEAFSNNASFLGQFDSDSADAASDWKIWECATDSATHTSRSDKTSVDVVWKAPANFGPNVTMWFSITRTFSTFHAQLKGLELSPDASCPPSATVGFSCDFAVDGSDVVASNCQAVGFIPSSIECQVNDQPAVTCTAPYRFLSSNFSGAGTHTLRVIAGTFFPETIPVTERTSSSQITINPRLSCSSDSDQDTGIITVSCTANGVPDAVFCLIDGEPFAPCELDNIQIETADYEAGSHILEISFSSGGLNSSATQLTFTVNPILSCSSNSDQDTDIIPVSCTANGVPDAVFCLIDDEPFAPCELDNIQIDTADYEVGSHILEISFSSGGLNSSATQLTFTGLGAVDLVNPPSGSVIANFEGAQNVSTLTCNVLNSGGTRTTTNWFLQDFKSNPYLIAIAVGEFTELFFFSGNELPGSNPPRTYRNELTILNFTSELDGVTLFCGTAINRQQANFSLRVYRPPALRDDFLLRVEENNGMVPVDLTEGFAAFPEPSFSWTRNGQPFSGLTYSTVVFDNVEREDAGNYNVSATNFILKSTTEQVGNDTGSFYLDVLYGPTFQMQGPTQRYVLINNTLSLICGTGLDSNPQATVTWTAPDGTTIMDNARNDLENGPVIVRLNFTHTILSDTGTWECRVVVMSEQYIVSGGVLFRQDSARIGELITVDIELTVISPPGQPRTLSVEDAGATSLRVCWDAPFNFDSPISFYTINARNLNSSEGMDEVVVTNTSTNATFFNVTGLLPGTTYELTVVAVSQGGDVVATSEPSAPLVKRTELTKTPQELVLNFINNSPKVSGGNITADILFSRPVESLQCALSGGAYQDCSSGSVTFVNVPPRDENNRVYFLRVVGETADGVRTVIRRAVRVAEEGFCLAHFINDGVTVDGTTATVEFDGVGNFNTFLCDLDRQGLEQCSSPQVYTNLSAGNHRVKVVPNIAECGRNRRARLITFAV